MSSSSQSANNANNDLGCVNVTIRSGPVAGSHQDGIGSFKGIPYAAAVEGRNRWFPPQPPSPWTVTLDATHYSDAAPQVTAKPPSWILSKAGATLVDLLDVPSNGPNCLSVNVWTPAFDPTGQSQPDETNKLPVMLWIHGGGLASGTSSTPSMDGTALAKQGVVVVSLNYRLGGIGFLAGDNLFDDGALVGNRGFMDVVAALQWIQDNIEQFGGDANNVTLLGQSAGGTCIWGLLASPASVGLFHRAIIMSGPIVMIDLEDHHKFTRDVLKKMKVPVGDSQALADASNDVIVGAAMQTMLYRRGEPYGAMSNLRLPAAGAYHTEFMPEDVLQALANAQARNIDLLIGTCKHDGRVAVPIMPLPDTIAIRIANTMFNGLIGDSKASRKALVQKYKEAMPSASSYLIHEQIQSDALYRMRSINAAEIHAGQNSGNTFMYQFNWESPAFDGAFGAFHGFDATFAFNNLDKMGQALGDEQQIAKAQPLANAISEACASFATTGIPSSGSLPEWPQYDAVNRQTMVFDRTCEVVADPDAGLRRIWAE